MAKQILVKGASPGVGGAFMESASRGRLPSSASVVAKTSVETVASRQRTGSPDGELKTLGVSL